MKPLFRIDRNGKAVETVLSQKTGLQMETVLAGLFGQPGDGSRRPMPERAASVPPAAEDADDEDDGSLIAADS